MKRILILLFAALLFGQTYNVTAQVQQDDPILLTVAGENVTLSEFLSVYKKNNVKGEEMDRKSLEEYMELYINFRLKVKEAEELGLDTLTSFKTELAGYRKQLAQPYLTDKNVDDNLLKEAWERMQFDIRASHILIRVDKNAMPEDTLDAYSKIMKLRERIMKGEAFEKVAREASEDPSSRDREDPTTKTNIKGNGGDLGYFTVLDMIYPFETGAYNIKPGTISMPIRTDYGYHLIKVTDRKPAMGKAQVAHIFIKVPADASAADLVKYQNRIDSCHALLKAGTSFEELVKVISDDKGSAAKGGVLPAFGVNRMVPEFIAAIAQLEKAGDISRPVKTNYGWHIIKLIERKPPKGFEEEKAQLKTRILKDGRSYKSKEAVLLRIRNEYGFKEYPETRIDFFTAVDTAVFNGKWDIHKADGLNKTMFTLGQNTYTQKDFAKYIFTKQNKRNKTEITTYVNDRYNAFLEESTLSYEDARLESKFPDFRALMKEYRDGILLFELTDQKVWSKAIKDTTGLKVFHEANKNNYMWDERLDASIFICASSTVAKNAMKLAKKAARNKMTEQEILNAVNTDSIPVLRIDHKLFLRKDNPTIDSIEWKKGITPITNKGTSYNFVLVYSLVAPEPKTLKEAKGIITADYQTYLEKEWIASLRKKYTWQVNQPVFESLFK